MKLPKDLRNRYTTWLTCTTLGYNERNLHYWHAISSMFIVAPFTIARKWKYFKCLSADVWIMKAWNHYAMKYYRLIKNEIMKSKVKAWSCKLSFRVRLQRSCKTDVTYFLLFLSDIFNILICVLYLEYDYPYVAILCGP